MQYYLHRKSIFVLKVRLCILDNAAEHLYSDIYFCIISSLEKSFKILSWIKISATKIVFTLFSRMCFFSLLSEFQIDEACDKKSKICNCFSSFLFSSSNCHTLEISSSHICTCPRCLYFMPSIYMSFVWVVLYRWLQILVFSSWHCCIDS